MSLCPLLDQVNGEWWCHAPTLDHVNAALPQAAIEAAIDALEQQRLAYAGYPKAEEFAAHIKQLQALLPADTDKGE